MSMAWKKKSSKEVYTNKYFRITEDEVTTDAGHDLTWYVVRSGPFAMIVPWDGEKFALVGQYRYGAQSASWEFPAGYVEGMTPEEAAKKELQEETGLSAKSIVKIGKGYTSIGRSDQYFQLFLATQLKQGKQHLEPAEEGMKVKRVTYSDLMRMINDGEVIDAPTISAVGFLHASGWFKEQGLYE